MEPIVITAIIAALASLGGAIIVAFSARGRMRVDYKTALDERIDKRVSDQLSTAWAQIDKLVTQNGVQATQMAQQANDLAKQRRIERIMYRYMQQLRNHIDQGNPPPPPTMPHELFEWYNDHK